MFKQSCTQLNKLPKKEVTKWLNTFQTIICDADGVLWHLYKAFDGAVDTFKMLRGPGRQMFVVTNTAVLSKDIVKRANDMGFNLQEHEMLTPALSIANFLADKKFKKKVYVVGEPGIGEELANVGICALPVGKDPLDKPMKEFAEEMEIDPDVGAVVVGKDEHFTSAKIIRACNYLQDPKVPFIGTCMDAAYPIGNNRLMIGGGAMISAVKAICGRKPLILGKPNPHMVAKLQSCGAAKPESTLMIGDTLYTDIAFGSNCGFQTLFVGTGVNSLKDVQKIRETGDKKKMKQVPDTYLPSFAALLEYLC